ncbi:hypothetical protein [Micromonospora avicenniae]|uniref:Uncharacterized protein n=1 Tax=Micromonospora avicenniae TaxID=1198245 RepID=A0A1N7F984_9ACTN|nr:hypothetical protein [Micromonospora avicenniae]SIR96836.1 hypothetical protein SAMN05444858_13212 [Micromonospora avicenniae]
MIEGWSIVPERSAVNAAGPNVEVVHGDGVTFAYGADALVVIVDAGDRPHGNAVDDANTLMLREPLPSEATQWMSSKNRSNQPLLGFVKMAEGCLALGELYQAKSIYRGMDPYTGEEGSLTLAD